MIPHTVMFLLQYTPPAILHQAKRHGPAVRIGEVEKVNACYCGSLPKQCKFVFERPRPGHWPSEKTLSKANKYGVFIVPQGPPKPTNICTYDDCDYQWRISKNLTERLFMFSLDTEHLKAYVLIKIIRKELFEQQYRDSLSSFHLKTALFYTVENTRPDVWMEDNLINCVKYILATLRRFLTRHICPHFTIENVNLFDGKIERHEFQKLVDKLTYMYVISLLRSIIEHIHMDNIGQTLNDCSTRKNERSISCTNGSALFNYICNVFQADTYTFCACSITLNNDKKASFQNEFKRLKTYYRTQLGKYKKFDYVLHNAMTSLASFLASAYLERKAEGHEYDLDYFNTVREMYEQTLEFDAIGNCMRYASFLFCNGEYYEACTYFDLIEKQIEKDKQYNLIYQFLVSPSEELALKIARQSCDQSSKQRRSVFLKFKQAEAMCVPEFLRCKIGNYSSSDVMLTCICIDDCICVHIEPYLYYLQYLTYRLLNLEPKRSQSLMKLELFTNIVKPELFMSPVDEIFCESRFGTSLNMLEHCLELEQKLQMA
ncbi:hypothetical protein DPMN_033233 [Dreissena polymorpha]|uniref:Mab-21-like HhH/H2TH-like domain-containing protein n=1 Tax=Dreissena polymorpha TaxID=45954 RepID=A0A9D4M687_DREPO|nr:hypothetical protein DPMN_033233 [Dreissena polymorpha]